MVRRFQDWFRSLYPNENGKTGGTKGTDLTTKALWTYSTWTGEIEKISAITREGLVEPPQPILAFLAAGENVPR